MFVAAKTKQELLAITEKELAKLYILMDSIDPKLAAIKDKDDTSIKDVVAHRAHWIDLFLGWHAGGIAGKAVCFPAYGYKWNQLKQYNAELRARQKKLSWEVQRPFSSIDTRCCAIFLKV